MSEDKEPSSFFVPPDGIGGVASGNERLEESLLDELQALKVDNKVAAAAVEVLQRFPAGANTSEVRYHELGVLLNGYQDDPDAQPVLELCRTRLPNTLVALLNAELGRT